MSKCQKCGSEYDEMKGGCVHCEQPISDGGVIEHYIEQDPSLRYRGSSETPGVFSTVLKIISFLVILYFLIGYMLYPYNIHRSSRHAPAVPALPTAEVAVRAEPLRTAEVAAARPDPPAAVPPVRVKTFDAVLSFSEGLAAFKLDGKFGFMDNSGTVVIPNKYEDAWWFTEGVAAVKFGGRWGFINKTGRTAVDFKFDELMPYSCKLAPVLSGGKWGYLDHLGAMAIAAQFDHAWWFVEDRAYVSNDTGFLIDKNGKTAFKLELPGDVNSMNRQRAEIKVRGCWKTGEAGDKQLFQPGYCFSEGLACITRQNKDGERLTEKRVVFDDYSGKPVIEEQIRTVEEAASFSNGLALTKIAGKIGFIDKTGKTVIANKYEDGQSFNEGLAAVKSKGKWGFIDKTGSSVIDFKFTSAYGFSEGLAAVILDNAWVYIDKKGEKIIDARSEDASNFYGGMAVIRSNGAWGFIDRTGKKLMMVK